MADPYSTLGVARTASEAEIKSAYRKLAKELHPARNKDNPKAAERFSEVTTAYDLLSDKDNRARFDRGEIAADGNPATTRAINKEGLKRNDIPEETQAALKQAHRILFRENLTVSNAIEKARTEVSVSPELEHLLDFVQSSERGIAK